VRRVATIAGAALLAACSQQPREGNAASDAVPTNSGAGRPTAEPSSAGSADASVASAPRTPMPSPSLTRDVGEPAVPEPGASPPATSLPEGPFAADSGQAAADVVQTYVALLEQGRVQQALRLWGDGGTNRPTIADLRRYREFHANVGGPGAVEGAAGSRYVTVPVQFSGTLRNGRAFVEKGTIMLRRVGEIDGATAAQKRWRIYSVDVKPAPRR
jgi:hypothetical protein